jgi:two-component system cell cycle response regulator
MNTTDPTQPPLTPEADPTEPDLGDSVILIVDDNPQNLELLEAYMEALPCRTLTATDGVQAIETVENERVDLVLLDVMMPRMSGFEVCKKLKSSPETRSIPIIMVTALNELGDVERGVESGTDDFLSKPVKKLELITRVRSLLRVRHLKRELDRTLRSLQQANDREADADEPGADADGDAQTGLGDPSDNGR